MSKIRVESVELLWPNGIHSVVDPDGQKFDPLTTATLALLWGSEEAPRCGCCTWDIRYRVGFGDGTAFNSIYKLGHHAVRQPLPMVRIDLGAHMLYELLYTAGLWMPPWMGPEEYAQGMDSIPDFMKTQALRIMRQYAITPFCGEYTMNRAPWHGG